MPDGIDLNGAGIDMYPGATTSVMTGLSTTGTTFRSEWLAELGKIAGLDSQLGKGPLGRPFAAQYNPGIQALVDGLDELGRRVETRAAYGNQCVRLYVATDAENARSHRQA